MPPMPRCPICRRQHQTPDICDRCRTRTGRNLADLTTHLTNLAHTTINPPAGITEYVSGGAFGSRPPLSIRVLSLTATTPTAILHAIANPVPPAPDAPIPMWVIGWAATWRVRLGHHQPPLVANGHPVSATASIAGDDPVVAHWTARFGHYRIPARIATDVAYLGEWLDPSWAQFADMPAFVGGLDRMASTVRGMLGESSIYLGRCPELGDDSEPCGGRLVRYATTSVTCPLCRATTDEDGLLMLARRIRETWGKSADRDAWRQ